MSVPTSFQRPEPSDLPKVGEVVAGRYTIERFIARGGMSHVFAARHAALGSAMALKVLDPKLFQGVNDAKLRFDREARIASRLRHPSIVEVFDIGVTESGLPFIAMELLDGQPLSKVIREQAPLPWPRARDFFLQILDALQVAHAAGTVHRDVKPDNCLVLTGTDHLKLLDFGIARVEDQTQVTVAGSVMGTPHYLSPEQARGASIDARTDVYSAAVVLYELLTGHCPFEEGTTFEIVGAHITDPPPPLSSQIDTDHLPDALPDLVLRALSKDPDQRPPDAGSFAATVRALDEGPAPPLEVEGRMKPGIWIGAAAVAFVIGLGAVGIASALSKDPASARPLFGAISTPVEPSVPTPAGPAAAPPETLAEPYDPETPRPAETEASSESVELPKEESPTVEDKPAVKRSGAGRKRRAARRIRKAASSCSKFAPPGGAKVALHVQVAADGDLHGVEIKAPYAGSVLGRCVARALGAVNVGSGSILSLDQDVRVGG